MTAPLRFLSGVVGLWCLGRAGVLLWPEGAFLPVAAGPARPAAVLFGAPAQAASITPAAIAKRGLSAAPPSTVVSTGAALAMATTAPPRPTPLSPIAPAASLPVVVAPAVMLDASGLTSPPPVHARSSAPLAISTTFEAAARPRPLLAGVALSSWALWRPGEGGATGFGAGALGGSQAGVRALVPILADRVPRLAVSARVSAPLTRRGLEAGLGVEWQPSADLPVKVLAERRERVAGEGRSAFALLAHGGVSGRALGRGLAVEAYGAAGVVGARSRDLFAEGAATVTRPVGPVRVGAGMWGGAQPGTARLDVGPTVALPLRLGDAGVRVSVDYRLRVAGAAAPGSGPALTIGTDF